MATLADVLRKTGYSQGGTLTAPAPTAPTLTTILGEHIRTLPQQIEANQRAMDKTTAGMDKFDIFGKPNPNYYPEAMKEFTQNYLPAFMGATAFHGTPHKILGKFDIKKVGTGEGAQAYGHGMYFAENPNVAKQYATDRSYVGKVMAGTPDNTPWDAQRIAQDTLNVHGDNAIAQLQSTLKANSQLKNPKQVEANKQLEDALNILKTNQLQPTGNLYKVDIPDEQITNMLDWDKPISQQSKSVQNAAQQLITKIKKIAPDADLSNMNGQGLYKLYQQYRGNNPDFASEGMNELGIKGIRYLDEGSRGTGKGTSNFVVFDPSTVKILEENSKPLTRKELIEQQLNKVVE